MSEPTNIVEFLDHIQAKYGKSASWIGEHSELDSSTIRRWKNGVAPSKASLLELRKTVDTYFPDETRILNNIIDGKAPCIPIEAEPDTIEEQIKIIKSIVETRDDLSDNGKKVLKELSIRKLASFNFDMAKKIALEATISAKTNEEENTQIQPDYAVLSPTELETKTYSLGQGYMLDIVKIPGGYAPGIDLYNIYLWGIEFGEKHLMFSVNKLDVEKEYGDFITGITIMFNQAYLTYLMEYIELCKWYSETIGYGQCSCKRDDCNECGGEDE